MYIEEVEKQKTKVLYLDVKQNSEFDKDKTSHVVISHTDKKVTLLHSRLDNSGRRNLVPFMGISKQEFKNYIDELQTVYDEM